MKSFACWPVLCPNSSCVLLHPLTLAFQARGSITSSVEFAVSGILGRWQPLQRGKTVAECRKTNSNFATDTKMEIWTKYEGFVSSMDRTLHTNSVGTHYRFGLATNRFIDIL